MTKRLFHLMPEADFETLKNAGATWGDIMGKYRQPAWCDYPQALGGIAGCWSLTGGKVAGQDFCRNCECRK